MSVLEFMKTYFNDNKCLKPIDFKTNNDKKDYIPDYITKYKPKEIHEYVSKLILDEYTNSDPNMQSLWCYNLSKQSYVYKKYEKGKKSEWTCDIDGSSVYESIFKPFAENFRCELGSKLSKLYGLSTKTISYSKKEKIEEMRGKYYKFFQEMKTYSFEERLKTSLCKGFHLSNYNKNELIKKSDKFKDESDSSDSETDETLDNNEVLLEKNKKIKSTSNEKTKKYTEK